MIEYRDEGVTSALGLGTYRNSIYGNSMSNPLKADVDRYLRKTSSPKQTKLRSFFCRCINSECRRINWSLLSIPILESNTRTWWYIVFSIRPCNI